MSLHRTLAAARPLVNALVAGFALAALAACTENTNPTPVAASSLRIIHEGAPVDISPDGNLALLEDRYSGSGAMYQFNVTTGALTRTGSIGDIGYDFSTGISTDGRVSGVYNVPVSAGIYTPGAGWTNIGTQYAGGCDINIAGAYDVSADGHVVVGIMWDGCNAAAFRWTDASGQGVFLPLQVLGTPWPGSTAAPSNRASRVSDNGLVVGGFAQTDIVDRWPAVWRADGTGFMLTGFPPDAPGEVLSINTDGSMVAGIWNSEGFYWTSASGTVDIGRLTTSDPSDPVYPTSIAAGGQLIFGTVGSPWAVNSPAAFVWTAAAGMQSLEQLAIAAGVPMPPGYHLIRATAASTDGTIVLGAATDAKGMEASFVLRLPVSAYGL